MVNVQLCTGRSPKQIFFNNGSLILDNIWVRFEQMTDLSREHFYIIHNGRIAYQNDKLLDGCATIVPKLLGGKGGFGSMLRAIGAQIEKTTNREACRDLSGRRLRDINEEKRLKAWIEKQAKREEEAAERKKKKLERLCAVPKHEFKDQTYEKERSILTERIGDAVEEGFRAAVAGSSGVKRKHEDEVKSNKKKTILDLDIDSDELDTSEDSEEEDAGSVKRCKSEQQVSNDSGHSSDETDKNNVKLSETKNVDSITSEDRVVQVDTQIESTKEKTMDTQEEKAKDTQEEKSMDTQEEKTSTKNKVGSVVNSNTIEKDEIINDADTVVLESKS
ncbi:hypothetical protein KPH14_009653 [Odynerus spinipes]|uniref:SDE2-like domain-containing protein n=1 Tax=Odynerus spinipes TaxID=1348599 RepID=A0AAD9RQF5_9HYME|nr:hypothetical protein KPH14_009653 [Odynerus spinipes]